jgi:hypothetical protein
LQVKIQNFVKFTKVYKRQGPALKLDVCAISQGAKHPVIQTFLPSDARDQLDKILHACPYGVKLFIITENCKQNG